MAMPSTTDEKFLKSIASLTMDCLKKLSAKGEKLTIDSLYESLAGMEEAEEIAGGGSSSALRDINYDLKEEIKRLTGQKTRLLSELDAIEEKSSDKEKAFRRMLLFFTGVMEHSATDKTADQLGKLKNVLKQQSSPEVLENAFNELKQNTYQLEVGSGEDDRKSEKSLLGGLFKGKIGGGVDRKYLAHLRNACRDIVNAFSLDLGDTFSARLDEIGSRVKNAVSVEDFFSLRTDLLSLIQDYISRVVSEREIVADFVKDLGGRLLAFEKILISAFENTEAIYYSSNEFTAILEGEMSNMTEILQSGKTLGELKAAVTAKFDIMRIAISEKNKRDAEIRKRMDRDIEVIKNDFEQMKREAEQAKNKAEYLEQEALTDPLTRVHNRRAYDKRVREEFQRYLRYRRGFSMLVLDIDHFKNINDTYGHGTGDKCLRGITERVRPLLRDTDMLSRYGGEEFVVLLPETDLGGAAEVAEKLRASVESIEFIHRNETIQVTISIGASETFETDKTPSDIFGRADTALYEAKNGGRNRVVAK